MIQLLSLLSLCLSGKNALILHGGFLPSNRCNDNAINAAAPFSLTSAALAVTAEPAADIKCQFSALLPCFRQSCRREICNLCHSCCISSKSAGGINPTPTDRYRRYSSTHPFRPSLPHRVLAQAHRAESEASSRRRPPRSSARTCILRCGLCRLG